MFLSALELKGHELILKSADLDDSHTKLKVSLQCRTILQKSFY